MWSCKASNAWIKYIFEASKTNGWMEKSGAISDSLPLSLRELFALIILAHLKNGITNSSSWRVGFDPSASEPNDGCIILGKSRVDIEHKLVPQMAKDEVLKAILDTYDKYAKRGSAYGSGRTLVIFGNKETQGMVKISSLRDKINGESPFDRVFLMHAVAMRNNNTEVVIHITEHFPNKGIAQVNFNVLTGEAETPHCTIKF